MTATFTYTLLLGIVYLFIHLTKSLHFSQEKSSGSHEKKSGILG
ncbi:MAG: hypothetical protein R2824_35970 [Saprospiraceae bacterium]